MQGLKREAEATLKHLENNPETARGDEINKTKLKKEMAYYDKQIEQGRPKTPRGANKDALVKRAEELVELMKVKMPTRDQMDHPAKNPGAIRLHMNWVKENDARVREYKEIMRRLEPQDPTATDIEKFRREK
jgi:hypothetical protein